MQDALTFAGAVLIASCPFSIELARTAAFASGSRLLLDRGAVITRFDALEDLAGAFWSETLQEPRELGVQIHSC